MKRIQIIKDFDYYIDEYMHDCRSRKLRPRTMQSYEQTLRLFERWCMDTAEIKTPQEVTESLIRHYICDLQERGKYTFYSSPDREKTNYPERRRDYQQSVSTTTINNYIRNMKVFFTWFSECESIRNPMRRVHQLKDERQARDYLDDGEISKLLRIFDKSYFSEHRDFMVIILLLDTGMRIGECLMIEMQDIDINQRTIMLPSDHTKGRRTRTVFFSNTTSRLLQQWMRFKDRYTGSPYLFPVKGGTIMRVQAFESNFRKYIVRSGIGKEISPHTLRNNFAKRCLMAGMDIYTLSRILGHSSVSVTEKAYLDLTDRDLRRRYQQFSPIENLKKY